MPTPNTPLVVHANALKAFHEYYRYCTESFLNQDQIRDRLLYLDRSYQREMDGTADHKRAQLANRYGDTKRLQNTTVPVVLPAVEAAVTYQTSVFLTGHPIFGVAAQPQFIDEALQLETIIENQSISGGWVRQLMMAFRDGFKYNLLAVECTWDTISLPAFETTASKAEADIKEVVWAGNRISRCDPYNLIYDHRVAPATVHTDGELVGRIELMSRIKVKEFLSRLPNKIIPNVIKALEAVAQGNYYMPAIRDTAPRQQDSQYAQRGQDWFKWIGLPDKKQKIRYQGLYEVATIYARIIPDEFSLSIPSRNTPQIFKLIYINGVLIYAERQTNAHAWLPILMSQPLEDGLGHQTKSLEENVLPIQEITSTLWNSVLSARRRAVHDRTLYDPSRIAPEQINNPNPSANIPVRPAHYGKPLSEAVYPFPFRDDQTGVILQETGAILNMANLITGQNPARQGQFVKGNKTQREFETVMGNANGRDQTTSLHLEAQLFTPLKHIIRSNILQYQGAEILLNRQQQKQIKIDPTALRKAILEFTLTDGLLPTDKVINSDAFSVAVQSMATSPQIGAGYNLAPAFSYLMKTQGADLRPFEKSPEQLAYEQALASWQQMAVEAIKAGATQQQLPPQPLPEQYGYVPGAGQAAQAAGPAPQQRVNNITNIIQNQPPR